MRGQRTKQPSGEKTSFGKELFFWGQALVIALVVLVLVNTFVVRISSVGGTSMVPTLHDQDRVIVQIIGFDKPNRGDIVVLMTKFFGSDPLVKRVIALGGDTIDIDSVTGDVSVNGTVINEPYIAEMIQQQHRGDFAYPYKVPDNCVFVMGDNRNHSSDSRVAYVGPIPYDQIIGRVIYRVLPIKDFGKIA